MLKLLITLIALVLIGLTAKAQHLIVTQNNDTIEAQIIFKNDSIYQYKRLVKPRIETSIFIKNVKKIIANGDDTLFNVFGGYSPAKESNKDTILIKKFELAENLALINPSTATFYLNKAGEHMNSAITLNLIGTTFIACSGFLIQEKKKEFVFIGANNVSYSLPYYENDFTLVYLSAGIGVTLNILSIVSWYQCSESLKMASQQQKFSFKASPAGASVAFRF